MNDRTYDNSRLIRAFGFQDVDEAFFNWWNNKLNLSTTTQTGDDKKVAVRFIAPERWALARDEGIRDEKNGTLILPIIAVSRTAKGSSNEGSFQRIWADTKSPHVYSKRIDPKSSLVKELINERRLNRETDLDPALPIYEIFTHKTPDHYVLEYSVAVWTTYIDEMNVLMQKIADEYDFLSVKSFEIATKDGYKFQAYQQSIESDSNFEDYSEEERIVRKIFKFKVPVYLFGESDQRRDNARRYFSQTRLVISKQYVGSTQYTPSIGIAAPSAISYISIAGTVSVGEMLIATPIGNGTVQWQRGDTIGGGGNYSNIAGETDTIYIVGPEDIGYSLRCTNADATVVSNVLVYDSVTDLPYAAIGVSTAGLTLADSNTTVDSWASSLGGLSVTLTAIAATNRPAYFATGGIGSRPLITTDGVDNVLRNGGWTSGVTWDDYELGVIGKRVAFSALNDAIIGYSSGGFRRVELRDKNENSFSFVVYAGATQNSTTDPDIYSQHLNGNSKADVQTLRVNGAIEVSSAATTTSVPDGGQLYLGAYSNGASAVNMNFQAFYYSLSLTDSQRTNLNALLMNYTGIPHAINNISIAGTVSVSGTLTATPTGNGTIQWQRGDTIGGGGSYSNIANATGTLYTVEAADIAYSLRCVSGSVTSNTLIYDSVTDLPFTAIGVSTLGIATADAGTTVDYWSSSLGGIAVTLLAPGATNRPAYSAAGGAGGRPLITFDGIDNALTGVITKGSSWSDYEQGFVGSRVAFGTAGDRCIIYQTVGGSLYFGITENNINALRETITGMANIAGTTVPDGNTALWSGDASLEGTGSMRRNGVIEGMASGTTTSRADGAVMLLGANVGNTNASNITMQAFYMGPYLTDAQRLNLRALLTNYTGVSS